MSLHAQEQFHAKYPLFDSQSERRFTFSYAILGHIAWQNPDFNVHTPTALARVTNPGNQ